ncbi:MAG: hypothetical protein QOF98_3812 [Streptomyces sp.]|nr:hypothetical protein [Streptomyces sp.]
MSRYRMPRSRRTLVLSAFALAGLATVQATGTSFAATAPLSSPQEVAHFDISTLQQPENITLEPNGSADLTFNQARQVARVTTSGAVTILATLPAPASGTAGVAGLVRASDGTLYVNYSAGASSGIYRIPAAGGTPVLVAALPDAAFLNGLALDPSANVLYATDSTLGKVWKVSLATGTAAIWAQGADFERNATGSSGFGVNGIKVHGGAVWLSNTDKGTLLRVPINSDGTAGTAVTKATGLSSIDDFSFTGSGDQVLAAQNFLNAVSLVNSDGTHTTVLTSTDGLENPTSTAVCGSTVYVASGAYFTHTDPNLLLATLS